jgi:hypothetical protein
MTVLGTCTHPSSNARITRQTSIQIEVLSSKLPCADNRGQLGRERLLRVEPNLTYMGKY